MPFFNSKKKDGHYKDKTQSVKCESCGALGRAVPGKPSDCEYCGTTLLIPAPAPAPKQAPQNQNRTNISDVLFGAHMASTLNSNSEAAGECLEEVGEEAGEAVSGIFDFISGLFD